MIGIDDWVTLTESQEEMRTTHSDPEIKDNTLANNLYPGIAFPINLYQVISSYRGQMLQNCLR